MAQNWSWSKGRRQSRAVLHSSCDPGVQHTCSDFMDILRRLIKCCIIIMDIIIVNTIITISTATLSSFTRIRWWPRKVRQKPTSLQRLLQHELLLQQSTVATTTINCYYYYNCIYYYTIMTTMMTTTTTMTTKSASAVILTVTVSTELCLKINSRWLVHCCEWHFVNLCALFAIIEVISNSISFKNK